FGSSQSLRHSRTNRNFTHKGPPELLPISAPRPDRDGPRPAGGPLLPARGNPVATRCPLPRYPPLSLASCGSKPTAAGYFDTHICSCATLASLALVVLNRRPAVMSMVG